jgi:hypothetical protein
MLLIMLFFVSVSAFAQMRDPTRPPFGSLGVDKFGIKIESIIYSKERKFAMVNGKTVYVGDIVSAFKVVAIEKDRVVFQGSEGTFSVSLYEDIKQRLIKEPQP